jgi:hypothetical protein
MCICSREFLTLLDPPSSCLEKSYMSRTTETLTTHLLLLLLLLLLHHP